MVGRIVCTYDKCVACSRSVVVWGRRFSSSLEGRVVELAIDESLCVLLKSIRENIRSYAEAAEVDAEDGFAEKSRTFLIDNIWY